MALTNSSSLQPHVCLSDNSQTTASKIAVNVHQANHGFTIGSVLRWNAKLDGNTYGYTAARANDAYNSEVVGVVSQVLGSNDFELCVSGIINMTSFFSNTTGVIEPGMTQDDVYFLSGYTAGWMTTERPTTTGWVAKPVITRIAHDNTGNIFGCVTNYVGSLLGGNIAVSLGNLTPPGTVQAFLGEKGNIPSGWAYCDGEGYTDANGVPGFKVSEYPEYYDNVGLNYGWVEALYTEANMSLGDKVTQTVGSGDSQRVIAGIVVGTSGGSEGKNYAFVKQADDIRFNGSPIFYGENGNFYEQTNDETRAAEVDEIDKTHSPKQRLYTFTTGNFVLHKSGSNTSVQAKNSADDSGIAGVFSVLPPDLRGRSLLGGAERAILYNSDFGDDMPEAIATYGGHSSFRLTGSSRTNREGVGGNLGLGDKNAEAAIVEFGWARRQSNLPPYMTVNWIVRVDPNAYAALIDKLEVKSLKLTGLPTDSLTTEYQEVYNDSGILKIDNTA